MNAAGDVVDGRFELVERLGSGGMGTVWRARDTVLHREVALKAVRSDADTVGVVRERVMREARALARLSHPHVVTVHQIVDAEPHPWIVMELVPGVSLQQRLDDGPLTPVAAARLGRQVLAALMAAHAAGIQHRDVKPANILLRPDGSAVLTDFGIAALQGTTGLTATGELVGSPEYMAPERIRGHGDDSPAADLWSLGVVLYLCVEGVSPLRRPTTLATLAAVLDDPLPPPSRSGPLTQVLQALLVRDPAARPDAARLDAMLARVETGATPHWAAQPTTTAAAPHPVPPPTPTQLDTPRPTTPQQVRGRKRRTPLVVAATAVLAIATATALVLTLRAGDTGGDNNRAAPLTKPPAPTSATPTRTPGRTPPGRWIAQLHSEPVSAGTANRDRRLATIRRTIPGAKFLLSDNYASLRGGYWVFYAPGPFRNGRAALTFCAKHDRTTANSCLGRYLSTDPTESILQCRPPVSAPTGYCTRKD
ncbi:serine/threonine protein kinase [Streptomyces ferrugineus]|uniref:non-specific serine/threonine protein kinase n=1 Tax=Streptomyces ferrugineus TaxID=1413221 RepID=A0A7M2SGG3_9ACTN|nr:serine/threonine-protein kinase [Streptomyces ferrugineus]QOV34875.1 serine/threonine protein kinase [Streptomyces ferrugineus]